MPPPSLKDLVDAVQDRSSLADLLKVGLGWPVDPEEAFQEEPEIAQGVKFGSEVSVSRLVPAGVEGERLILLAEFSQPYVRRDLRELLRSLKGIIRETGRFEDHTGIGDTIFIVAAPSDKDASPFADVRFVLFEEQEKRVPRIRSFGWRREFIGRTVLTHNLERLEWSARVNWDKAWDVEGLTEQFYRDYAQVFANEIGRAHV